MYFRQKYFTASMHFQRNVYYIKEQVFMNHFLFLLLISYQALYCIAVPYQQTDKKRPETHSAFHILSFTQNRSFLNNGRVTMKLSTPKMLWL
jgi:hypothetical protein